MDDQTSYAAEFRLAIALAYLVSGNTMDQIADLFEVQEQRFQNFALKVEKNS
jgi:transposase-like protein